MSWHIMNISLCIRQRFIDAVFSVIGPPYIERCIWQFGCEDTHGGAKQDHWPACVNKYYTMVFLPLTSPDADQFVQTRQSCVIRSSFKTASHLEHDVHYTMKYFGTMPVLAPGDVDRACSVARSYRATKPGFSFWVCSALLYFCVPDECLLLLY